MSKTTQDYDDLEKGRKAFELVQDLAMRVEKLEQLGVRKAELVEPREALLVAGNHLASAMIGLCSIDGKFPPPYTASIEQARAFGLTGDQLEVWIAWQGLMLFRDATDGRDV